MGAFDTSTRCRDSSSEGSGTYPYQFGYATGPIPIGYVNVRFLVNKTSVRRAECRGRDFIRVYVVVCPLRLLRIVAEKGHWNIIAIENRDSSFEF
jgi:hypothetical protein